MVQIVRVARCVERANVEDRYPRGCHGCSQQSRQGGITIGDQRRTGMCAQGGDDVRDALTCRRAVVGFEVPDLGGRLGIESRECNRLWAEARFAELPLELRI